MSKYAPLTAYLEEQPREISRIKLSFAELETIIGGKLPQSARRHRPWWGNEANPNRTQSAAWLSAGWKVERVDLENQIVTFVHSGL